MINKDLNLNPDIFEEGVITEPIRNGYGKGLLALGKESKDVVVLTADLNDSTRTKEFSEKYPDRFFEVGVAEQNMANIAAGLGISGKIPFISSYGVFSPGRNWEQIRSAVAYNDSNVKIAGHHAGFSASQDGATHQAIEDIATMRVIPNMRIFIPCDASEAKRATVAAGQVWGPVYLRLSRNPTPVITTKDTPFVPGRADVFWESRKPEVLIIACGRLVYNALLAAKELEKEKLGTIVVNCHTIKPLDEKTILDLAKKVGAVVSVEEHNVLGGLGGTLSELFAKHQPIPMEFIGLQDVFGESGKEEDLLIKYGMGVSDIKLAVRRVWKRK